LLRIPNVPLRVVVVISVLACSRLAAAQASVPAPPSSSRPVTTTGYARELLWPAAPPERGVEHPILYVSHDFGLITAGILLLTAGMGVGVAYAMADASGGNCRDFFPTFHAVECGSEPFALVPFAGPILVGSVHFRGEYDDGWPLGAGLIALAPQILGLVLLLMGVHGTTADVVPRDPVVAGFDVSVLPFASSHALGLTLRIDG